MVYPGTERQQGKRKELRRNQKGKPMVRRKRLVGFSYINLYRRRLRDYFKSAQKVSFYVSFL
jgi:hypothetical protein